MQHRFCFYANNCVSMHNNLWINIYIYINIKWFAYINVYGISIRKHVYYIYIYYIYGILFIIFIFIILNNISKSIKWKSRSLIYPHLHSHIHTCIHKYICVYTHSRLQTYTPHEYDTNKTSLSLIKLSLRLSFH